MIIGEEEWINGYAEEDYDLFFKKIRKKLKKIKPLKIFKPLGVVGAIPKTIAKKVIKKKPKSQPQVDVQAQVQQATAAKEVQLASDRKELLQEIADFEQKKVEEVSKLDQAKIETEQKEIDAEQGETKKMLYIGLITLGGLVIIGGIVAYIKSRQNQLKALNIKEIQQIS